MTGMVHRQRMLGSTTFHGFSWKLRTDVAGTFTKREHDPKMIRWRSNSTGQP